MAERGAQRCGKFREAWTLVLRNGRERSLEVCFVAELATWERLMLNQLQMCGIDVNK